jgi:choloylglycine hydrolase
MKSGTVKQVLSALFLTVMVGSTLVEQVIACTHTLYVGDDGTVMTGRNMDWKEDMASNLWIFSAGMQCAGAAGPQSIQWESKYGSVCVSGYEAGTTVA